MDISKIKVGNTAYDVKDTTAREAIESIGEMASPTIDDKDATLSWGTKTTIAEIGETAIHVTLPSNPDTNIVTSVAGKTGDVTLGKSDVGLGNVDNTADANKLVLYAATAGSAPASDVYSWAKASSKPSYSFSEISGTVSSSQLPSYVDDVLEYDTKSGFPSLGEGGKIYVNKADNTTWRWSGSAYVQIKGDLVIGTTSGTAYDGASGAALKSKLDGIESGAQVHKAPTSAEVKSALGTGSGTSKYLREDGTWVTPPNDNTWPTALSLLTNDVGYITSYTDTNTVTSINGKTGEIAAADMAAVLTAAGYKLTDADTDTWRPVQCNSTSIGTSTLNLIAGTNVTLSRDGGNITISSSYTDTNTWRPITNTYTGSDQSTSVSQYGTNAMYNALANGYASSAGNADTIDNYHIAVVTSMPSSPDTNTIYIVK